MASPDSMRSTAPTDDKINPYRSRIYDFPDLLLPEPERGLLNEKRLKGPPCSGKLVVELGSGAGGFIQQLASRWPECHLIGFELRFKRLVKAARKIEREGLRNVWLLRETAQRFHHYFDSGTVDLVCINFPDPWPKASQWKKRLISADLLDRLETCLKPGGEVRLKTDHSGYFLHILSLFRDRPQWRIRRFSNDLHRDAWADSDPRSEFEQLFAAKRRAIFFIEYCLAVEKPES